jgi:hypothetical protein
MANGASKRQIARESRRVSRAQDFLAIHASVPMMLANHFVSNSLDSHPYNEKK